MQPVNGASRNPFQPGQRMKTLQQRFDLTACAEALVQRVWSEHGSGPLLDDTLPTPSVKALLSTDDARLG